MQFLKDEGLIAPDEISSDEDRVPLDFTRLSYRLVGSVHSRYAVRHTHAIYCAGRYRSRLVTLQRNLRITRAVKRGKLQGKFKTKWELDDALVLDKEIKDVEDKVTELEARLIVVEAAAEGYEDLRNAASREMFRRSSEQAPKD